MKKQNYKNTEVNFTPMSREQMQEVDGGFWPLIIIGIGLLLSSCKTEVKVEVHVDSPNNSVSSDSTGVNVSPSVPIHIK